MTEATTLRAKMEQKNQLLVSLQQETARLMKTHTRTLHEVRRNNNYNNVILFLLFRWRRSKGILEIWRKALQNLIQSVKSWADK